MTLKFGYCNGKDCNKSITNNSKYQNNNNDSTDNSNNNNVDKAKTTIITIIIKILTASSLKPKLHIMIINTSNNKNKPFQP